MGGEERWEDNPKWDTRDQEGGKEFRTRSLISNLDPQGNVHWAGWALAWTMSMG